MCDYAFCKLNTTNTREGGSLYTCVWCNRNFHKQCLFSDRFNPGILFEQTHNIQCSFCSPNLPIQIYETGSNDVITVQSYGTYVDSYLESNKTNSESGYVYPIGYSCSRQIQSYKNRGYTTVNCEVHAVDEKYFEQNCTGDRDVYLFRVMYQDDAENPIEVLGTLRSLAAKINEKYTSRKVTNGLKFFGLDIDYVQYLISTHVPDAQDFGTPTSTILQRIYDKGKLDKCTVSTATNLNVRCSEVANTANSFIYGVNNRTQTTAISFDPQKQLFNF